MLDSVAALLIGKPLHILLVAALFAVGHVIARLAGRQGRSLLVVASAWLAYALWEWFVQYRSPDANIRVDLLLIWPVLAILTVWFLIKQAR